MSQARLKRIAALEDLARRRSPERAYIDPFDAAMRLWVDLQAVVAGKAEWIPRPDKPISEEQADALARTIREFDLMHDRLMAERKAG